MNHLDAFYNTVHSAPGGCEAVAPRMGMSAAILRNKANPNAPMNKPTLDEADRLMGLTGNYEILHALAGNHGHVCVRIEDALAPGDMAVLDMMALVWQTNGDVGAEVQRALADGKVTQAEMADIRAAARRAQRAIETIVAGLNGMAEKG